MPAWAAFGALTVFLVVVLLLLSIVSASAVDASRPIADRSAAERSPTDRSTADRSTRVEQGERWDRARSGPEPFDPRFPRFESPETADPGRVDETGRLDEADGPPAGMSTGALLANVALTQGLFGVGLVAGAVYFEIPFSALGLSAPLLSATVLVLGVTAGLALWIGNELAAGVADAANVAYDEGVRSMLAPDSTGGWVLLLGAILPTIAVVEELLFRGAAIGAFAVGFDLPAPLLLVVSSLAFGGAHGAQGRVGAAVATVLGFVLGVVFLVTGSLFVVVIAHYLVNALEFVVHEGLDRDRPRVATVAVQRRGR